MIQRILLLFYDVIFYRKYKQTHVATLIFIIFKFRTYVRAIIPRRIILCGSPSNTILMNAPKARFASPLASKSRPVTKVSKI